MPEADEWRPEDRFLFLVGEISDELTKEIMARILQHWDREFLLVINSDGGSCHNALGLINMIRLHGRIDTLCVGVAESGGADCLAAGRRRFIVPGSVAMLHQISWELGREFTANLSKNARALERLNDLMADRLVQFTGRSREELDRDMATDFYLFDQEIIDYGLADEYWSGQWLPAEEEPKAPRRRKPGARRSE